MGPLKLLCSPTLLVTPLKVTLNSNTAAHGLCLLSAAESLQKRRISVDIKSECPSNNPLQPGRAPLRDEVQASALVCLP